jgi:hypothetical protein
MLSGANSSTVQGLFSDLDLDAPDMPKDVGMMGSVGNTTTSVGLWSQRYN